MSGGLTTTELVVAACEAGALGSIAGAALSPDSLREEIRTVRAQTDRPFAVNLFAPVDTPEPSAAAVEDWQTFFAPYREQLGVERAAPRRPRWTPLDQLAVVAEERVPVFSFTLGILPLDGLGDTILLGTANHRTRRPPSSKPASTQSSRKAERRAGTARRSSARSRTGRRGRRARPAAVAASRCRSSRRAASSTATESRPRFARARQEPSSARRSSSRTSPAKPVLEGRASPAREFRQRRLHGPAGARREDAVPRGSRGGPEPLAYPLQARCSPGSPSAKATACISAAPALRMRESCPRQSSCACSSRRRT